MAASCTTTSSSCPLPEVTKLLLVGRHGCGKSGTAGSIFHYLSGERTMQFTIGDGCQLHTTRRPEQARISVVRSGKVRTYEITDSQGLAPTSSKGSLLEYWWYLRDLVKRINPHFVILVTSAQDFRDSACAEAAYARRFLRNIRNLQGLKFCSSPVPVIVTHVTELLTRDLSAAVPVVEQAMRSLHISTNVYPVENYGREGGPDPLKATNATFDRLFTDFDNWLGHAVPVAQGNFPSLLTIVRAWYGYDQENTAYGMDVTRQIQDLVQGSSQLPPTKATNQLFNKDPCPHWAKKLWIRYRYNYDEEKSLVCAEGQVCRIPETQGDWPIWENE
ncbi:hypothetical protein Pelo_8000 [Pelomyxa schiedti]|nr:hypothetical protein Pelo_8000 [Pelomyxa schiedti]